MQQYPEPIVGAFIFNQEGELLLLKSHKWKGMYCIPGGHVEVGETMENALKREVKEETGLVIYDPLFLCCLDFINDSEFHKKKHMIFLNFLVKTTGRKVTLNDEAEEYVWVNPKKALELPLNTYTKLTIEKYILTK